MKFRVVTELTEISRGHVIFDAPDLKKAKLALDENQVNIKYKCIDTSERIVSIEELKDIEEN